MLGYGVGAQWIILRDIGVDRPTSERSAAMPELTISAEKVAFLIEKAREFDVKEGASDPDSGSNAADDNMIDVLEDNGNDPVVQRDHGLHRRDDGGRAGRSRRLDAARARRRHPRGVGRFAPRGRGRPQWPAPRVSARRADARRSTSPKGSTPSASTWTDERITPDFIELRRERE